MDSAAQEDPEADHHSPLNLTCRCGSSSCSLPPSSSSSLSDDEEEGADSPVDGGWGWVVVAAAFFVNLVADGVSLSFGVLFVDLVDFFGESKANTSWVGSVFLAMPLLAGPLASYLIERFGCRRMCIVGALVAAGGLAAGAGASGLWPLFAAFSLAGLGLAACYVAAIVVVARWFERRRSLATGLAACGTGLGTFLFPPLTLHLLDEYAWQGTLLLMSGFFLNMAVFGALMRDVELPAPPARRRACLPPPSPPSQRLCSSMLQLPTYLEHCPPTGLLPPSDKGRPQLPAAGAEPRRRPEPRLVRGSITYRGAVAGLRPRAPRASSCPDLLRRDSARSARTHHAQSCPLLRELVEELRALRSGGGFALFCLSNFALYACVDVPYVYVPDHAHSAGSDMESASFLVSILGVLNCLGVVIVGYIGDKPWIDPSLLYSGFIFLSGMSLVLLPLISNYYAIATLVGVYGFTISANYTLVPVIIVNLISLDNFTGAYGLLLLVQGIASLIGPPVAGALFDMTGNYDVTFFLTGIFIILSGAMVVPVAKSATCGHKASRTSSKDSLPPDTPKVCFREGKDSNCCRNNRLETRVTAEGQVHCLKENSVPLLPGSKNGIKSTSKNCIATVPAFENPLSIV